MGSWWLLLCSLLGPLAPPAGDDWTTTRTAHFAFVHQAAHQPLADDLAVEAELQRDRVLADLGTSAPEHIQVRLCDGLGQMQQLAPEGARVPAWAAGMAFDRHDLILLRVDQRSGRADRLGRVFVHELAHLALSRAVGRQGLPRWFHEGFAIYHSGQWSLGRMTALGSGVLAGRLFSLQALTESFPSLPPDVELAYAQSIDFVAYLLHQHGRARFHQLIDLLSRSWSFLDAVEEAFDTNIFRLEDAWHADLKMRFTWLPVLTGTATLWALATLVLVAAWLRKRRTRALALERMGEEAPDEDDVPPPPLTPTSP